MRLPTFAGGAVALAVCALALGACGSDGGGGSGAANRSEDEAALAFARCMREHGVDVPDPQPGGGPIELGRSDGPGKSGGGPDTRGAIGGAPVDLDDPETQEAMEACREELGDSAPQPPSEQERQEFEEAALEFAQCMRDHGIDMADPTFSEAPDGGFLVRQEAGADADSPAFRAAERACQDEFPKAPGRPGAG